MQQFIADVYNVLTPVGVDVEIAKIQTALIRLPWLSSVYGRSNIQRRQLDPDEVKNRLTTINGVKGKDLYFVFYPQGRYRGSDYDLSLSDSLPSACFFYLRDPTNTNPASDTWDNGEDQVMIAQPMSLVIYGDFSKLNPGSNDDFSEQLKTQILNELKRIPRIVVQSIWKDFDNVLKDFSVTQRNSIFTRYPFFAYKIDFTLTYPAFPENGNGAYDPDSGTTTKPIIGWRACRINFTVVASGPVGTQTLDNGDVIPAQFVANGDGSLTIAYLQSVPGMGVLTTFELNNEFYGNMQYNAGTFGTNNGKFGPGDNGSFDATVPIYSI